MRIAVFCFARPTFDIPLAEAKAKTVLATLAATGAEIIGDATLLMDAEPVEARLAALNGEAVDGVLIVQASFCDAVMARRLGEALAAPIGIWAFPEARDGGRLRLNSFCGLNLAAHALGKIGRGVGYWHAPADSTPDLAALFRPRIPEAVLRPPVTGGNAGAALEALRGAIGLIGEHPDGFDTCAFDEADLSARFGVNVERIALSNFFDLARQVDITRVEILDNESGVSLSKYDDMEVESRKKSLRAYAALRDLADVRNLNGVAVRCWPETFTDYGCAVCGAMARMTGEGVPAACEADMLGAVGGRLLQELSGGPAMLVDIVDMDPEDDTAVLWHCGLAPLAFCDPGFAPEAALHTNRQKPLLYQFPMKPGQITVMRISQAAGEMKMVIGRGEMLRRPMSFTGTSGVVRLDGGTSRARDLLIGAGLEHHLSFAYGDVKAGLEAAAAAVGLPVLDLDAA